MVIQYPGIWVYGIRSLCSMVTSFHLLVTSDMYKRDHSIVDTHIIQQTLQVNQAALYVTMSPTYSTL